MCMQDYKSRCAAVMICATLVNIEASRQTVTDTLAASDQLIRIAQPAEAAELKTTDQKLM